MSENDEAGSRAGSPAPNREPEGEQNAEVSENSIELMVHAHLHVCGSLLVCMHSCV